MTSLAFNSNTAGIEQRPKWIRGSQKNIIYVYNINDRFYSTRPTQHRMFSTDIPEVHFRSRHSVKTAQNKHRPCSSTSHVNVSKPKSGGQKKADILSEISQISNRR